MLLCSTPHVHVSQRSETLCNVILCTLAESPRQAHSQELIMFILFRLMNIMYYDQKSDANTKKSGGITMGPLYITPEQVCSSLLADSS
jgi:hypothetical protein